MNAPATHAALRKPIDESIAIKSIQPSGTHIQELRRARFDKKTLEELAESIKSVGVLQPIVVRSNGPKGFEIVAGERRFLAAKMAGLTDIRASVCVLNDEEVLEVQLIENLQREGLHELEEAEGYEELMKLKKINADALAEMVGKSRSYVYARTKLLALCPEARKAFYAGDLDGSRALLVARIGHHDSQRQALKEIAGGGRGQEPMSYREAHRHIVDRYMLQLKSAPFDIKDADLVPKAGDCIKCPKRTGNQADLFGDVKSADVCTDPKCFDSKRQAFYAGQVKDLVAKGQKVLAGDDAKKAFPDWDSRQQWNRDRMSERYVPAKESVYVSNRGNVKIADLLGPDFEPTIVQHPGTGKLVEVASRQAVDAAMNRGRSAKASKASAKPKAPAGPDVDEMLLERLVKLLHEKSPKAFGLPFMRGLARLVLQATNPRRDHLEVSAKQRGWPASAFSGRGEWSSRSWPAQADKLDERGLVLLMLECVFHYNRYDRKPVLDLFGINEHREREHVIEQRKLAAKVAREAARAAKASKPKAAKASKPKAAAKPKVKAKPRAQSSKGKKK